MPFFITIVDYRCCKTYINPKWIYKKCEIAQKITLSLDKIQQKMRINVVSDFHDLQFAHQEAPKLEFLDDIWYRKYHYINKWF